MKRVLFYCQHCVGFGHLVRSSAIVRALARDFSVMFVTGGPSVTGFELPSDVDVVRLPEIQTDAEFECLQACDAEMSLEETQALRKELLIRAFDSFRPHVVITELYPFGRKRFAFEAIRFRVNPSAGTRPQPQGPNSRRFQRQRRACRQKR